MDGAVIAAAVAIMGEDGPASLTVESVAERAGVGKAAIYRRWESKDDLLVEAVASLASAVEIPGTGNLRDDLVFVLRGMCSKISGVGAGAVFPWLMGEMGCGSELGRRFAELVIVPRRRLVADLLRRAIKAGEVRRGLDLELAIDMLFGPFVLRRVTGSLQKAPRGWEEKVVDGLLTGWQAG